jgi:hypothetical protein
MQFVVVELCAKRILPPADASPANPPIAATTTITINARTAASRPEIPPAIIARRRGLRNARATATGLYGYRGKQAKARWRFVEWLEHDPEKACPRT